MPGRTHPTRRSFLLAGLALPLAGCSIRLERDAPHILGIPTAAPPADSQVMQDAVTRLRAVAAHLVGQEPAAWTVPLQRLHTDQADRLVRIAASAGIEITDPTASPSSTVSSTPPSATSSDSTSDSTSATTSSSTTVTTDPAPTSTPGSASATTSSLPSYPAAATEAAAITPAALRVAAGAAAANRPVLLATLAGHRAAARVLARADLPVGTGLPAPAAAAVLEPLRLAVYVAETVIAKTPGKDRGELSTLLTTLYAERMRLGSEAGASARPEQLSYALPTGADDPARARTTMAGLLHDCAIATASRAGDVTTAPGATRLVQLWGDLVAAAWTWGQAPDTFLGLR